MPLNQSAPDSPAAAPARVLSPIVPRKDYPPLAPDQLAWLRSWSCTQVATLARVMAGMERLGYDAGQPTYRRAYAALLELKALANVSDSAYLWATPPWRASRRG